MVGTRGGHDLEARPGLSWLLRRYVAAHLLAVISEWASLIGLLVYAFERSGPTAVGIASIITLLPHLLLAATMVRVAQRFRPATARAVSLVLQAVGYGLAATVAIGDGPLAPAVAGVALAFIGVTMLRPSGAVLLPALVRSSLELTTASLRVGWCESASTLVGPLVATALLAVGGGGAVLAGSAGLVGLASLTALYDLGRGRAAAKAAPPPKTARVASTRARLVLAATSPFADIVAVGRGNANRGALGAAIVQYVVIGGLDITLVVIAGQHLDLGDAGAGILTTLFGIGAVLSIALSGLAVRHQRIAPGIVVGLGGIAAGTIVLGASLTVPAAIVALPLVGCSRSFVDVMSRLLLQRSAPPSELAKVFGALETGSGVGMLLGSGLAQVVLALAGVGAALIAIGVFYVMSIVVLLRSLRLADAAADVPVVAMSVLRRLPVFAPLPTPTLESVARSAVEVSVDDGELVIRQGDQGDRFYAVCDGDFDVRVDGDAVRALGPGTGFGEVALLAAVPRTASVQATSPGQLLAIERGPFLVAVTGFDQALEAAWDGFRGLTFSDRDQIPPLEPR